MAEANSARQGVMTWVSTIRTTMANDPGRQILEDQIQNDGFMFLEDYLDNILSGPRHDPIIELVKTPGRKRDIPRKTRAATAAANKAKSIITMDLDDEELDKENAAPIANSTPFSAFHKALLQSKDVTRSNLQSTSDTDSVTTKTSKKKATSKSKTVAISDSTPEHIISPTEEEVKEDVATLTHESTSEVLYSREVGPLEGATSHVTHLNPGVHPTHSELSIIEEGDEAAERSRHSLLNSQGRGELDKQGQIRLSSSSSKSARPTKTLPNIDMMAVMDIDDFTQTTNFTIASASVETTRSPDDPIPATKPELKLPVDNVQSPIEGLRQDYESAGTKPSAPIDSLSEPLHREATTETMGRKPGHPQFPTLGPPSPLRKSVRVPREPSLAGTHTAQAPKSMASRSSWLVKAREAKALEENAKKANMVSIAQIPTHNPFGNKRKSGEMLGHGRSEPLGLLSDDLGDPGRTQKMSKVAETSPILPMLKEQDKNIFGRLRTQDEDMIPVVDHDMYDEDKDEGPDGMIIKLKKTVAGFRAVKSSGKSLGGAAATALAEARAAAEAKVAERNAAEGRVVLGPGPTSQSSRELDKQRVPIFVPPPLDKEHPQSQKIGELKKRTSMSDLAKGHELGAFKLGGERERVFQPPNSKNNSTAPTDGKETAKTTLSNKAPTSPTRTRPPVFTNPDALKRPFPTYVPPPVSQVFTKVEAQPVAPSRAPQLLSAHSTIYSTQSTFGDPIFDHDIPHWVPSTQDTDFSDNENPFSNNLKVQGTRASGADTSGDESWHLDEKFGETWTPIAGMKDDSMTWSTAPTRSTRSGGRNSLAVSHPASGAKQSIEIKSTETVDMPIHEDQPMEDVLPTDEEEDMDIEEGVTNVRLVETPSQPDAVQAQLGGQTGGFFSSATRLVSSVLGSTKKVKEPVKSIQLAAAAAKKQQEEADKKANRLKEMEARRQQVAQKKADEDKAREEKRVKDEEERRRREKEKEDATEKRALKQPGKKVEEDQTKKRFVAELEKKAEPKVEPKKLLSKDKKDVPASKLGKIASANSSTSQLAIPTKLTKQSSTTSLTQPSTSKPALPIANDPKHGQPVKSKTKIKDKVPAQNAQMQARYQAQLEDNQTMPPPESIELPDIDSEYYDSDDENRKRALPNWAQSPALREALQSQSTVDPDDIFGAIKPLKMEELFKTRTSRFRARTSSANWAGTDELTAHEEREYARRMGYKK